jgi:hypothetical protein
MEAQMGQRRASSNGEVPVKRSHLPERLDLSLEVASLPMPDNALTPIPCPRCGLSLGIHQPDAEFPDQLLGTCDGCGTWFLVAVAPDGNEAVVVYLPTVDLVERTLSELR